MNMIDRERLTASDLQRWWAADAERAGYKALCFTVDTPVLSNREDDEKNK